MLSSHCRGALNILVVSLLAMPFAGAAPAGRGVAAPPATIPQPDGPWMNTVRQQVAADEYHVTWQGHTVLADLEAAWQAPNRAQGLRTYFAERGIRVVPRLANADEAPAWDWSLALVAYGSGERVWAVPAPALSATDNRIEYRRGALTEWYINEPRGLEQGFTLPAPPEEFAAMNDAVELAEAVPAPGAGHTVPVESLIHLDLELDGPLSPSISADGRSIDFLTPSGARAVRYDRLVVTDATGRELESWMEGIASPVRGVRLVADATDAVWPLTVDPLATSPAWTAEGDQANAWFGYAIATAGDVNGDGYSDVIVGAGYFDNGQTDEGRTFVYRGSASGLLLTPSWTAESDQANALFGVSVSTAGDVNGDGYADVIVGTQGYDNIETNEGRAYVYLGSASGLAPTPSWTAESNTAGAVFGLSVSTAGDVNGDGYSDVIVGAPLYTNGESVEGRALVYLGSASGLAGAPNAGPADAAWRGESDSIGGHFGQSVSTAGDVNGDGYADIIVGAYFYSNGQSLEGKTFVYLGSASGLAGAPNAGPGNAAWTAESDQGFAHFGQSVSTAGDVNGDGYSDVIVGADSYDNGQTDEGRAFVYLGSASGPSLTPSWTAESDQASAFFGWAVSTAGDVNGDGYADVIVAASDYTNGETQEGRAFVYLGSAAGLATSAAWTAESDQIGAYLQAASTAGDVNGDGYSDVIVGAINFDNGQTDEGRTYVYLGSASGLGTGAVWTAEGNLAGANLGHAVGTAGDVNGDGYADVIVGAPGYDNGQTDEGRAFLYLGSASGPALSPAWTAESNVGLANFGTSVGTTGDVNGDGYSDVIVGAYSYDNGQTSEGRAYVYLGSASGPALSPAWTAESNQSYAYFGGSVGTAGDVNGDGYADVIVGAYGYDNGQPDEGRAYVYLGSASGPALSPAWTAESNLGFAAFGISVGTAGDVNRDGYADVIVGAQTYANGQSNEGRAYVYLGSASGPALSPAWTAESNQSSAYFGGSVGTAGDVNGDGYADVIVGAWNYGNGQSSEGRAYVYLGSASGPALSPAWTAESDQASANFGVSVGTAGDVNSDGYADVIVGAWSYGNGQTSEGRAYVYLGSVSGPGPSPAWTAESNQANAYFGVSVGTAGDVNGDGYADVIVGADFYSNGQSTEGRAFVYLGNGGGVSRLPRQLRTGDYGPIVPGSRSDTPDGIILSSLWRTPFGRAKVGLEMEVVPRGTLFDGSDTSTIPPGLDSGVGGFQANVFTYGFDPGTAYHWRIRQLYNPAMTPFQAAGPWFTMPVAGWNETLFTTRLDADLSVTQTDLADPVTTTQQITYSLSVASAGPDPADVIVVDTLPASSTLVSATPSQGSCGPAVGGVVTCSLGTMSSGGGATITIVVTPAAPGIYTNVAQVSGAFARDVNAANNNASEPTTVVASTLGGRVWEDRDGDGVQDAGEPSIGGVLVHLLNGVSGAVENGTVTGSGGTYLFATLPSSTQRLRFTAPTGWILTMRDMGGNDALDSDADFVTGETVTIGPAFTPADATRWDAGLRRVGACIAPDEEVYIYGSRLSTDGNNYMILDFQDPNQSSAVTGYNVYRSSDAGVDPVLWPLVASDVVDMDQATANKQWVDQSNAVSPSGVWFYDIAPYNSSCDAEGPR